MKSKKITLFILSLLVSMAAMASDYTDYYNQELLFRCYNDTKTAEVFVSDFHWTRGQIVIPKQVELNGDSYTVTAIADRAFESTTISKVTLPPTIERIGDCAFAGTLIESVELPDSLKELGKEAFYDCFLLQSVTFPNAGKDIKMGERVFAYTSLESVELPEGITSIPEEAFDSDTQLKSVILPSTLKSIGDGAFYECGMTAITLPEGLESLGNWVFCMSALESVELPESLKEIGDYALSYTKLTSLNLPSSFTVIPNGIYAASNIKEIDIPEHIREIGYAAFECCNSLRKVTMHNGMTVIGNGAFNSCMALEEIEIPETVEEMGYGVFYGTNNLRKLTFNGKVTKFAGNLCIPDSCEVIIDEENKVLEMIDNVLVQNTPDGRRVAIMIPQSKVVDGELTIGGDDGITEIAPLAAVLLDVKNVAIGEGVTRIGSVAFEESTLETITLPSTLKELGGSYTFSSCHNLRSIDIPEGVTSIPYNCFFHCPSLTHVGLPSSIKHLKSNSFAYTPQLEEISLPEGLENIDDKAFYNSGLKKVAVPSSCKEYCFNYLDSLQQVELAEGAIDIPADAFKFCFALESARLPNSLKTIGDNAFHVCPKLSDVTIPEGVESIGQYAFRRTGIENLVIPESATKIDIYAFDGCQQLKTAVINAPLKRIPVGMFSECTSLETVNLPNSINSIGSLAFCNDNNFEIPALPENVSTIGLAAFAACKNTEEIVLPDSLYMLGEYCFEDVDVKSLDLSKTQLRMLEKNIFCNSQSLASVKLPSTLIGMYDNFYDCPSITLVDVPCQEPPVFELTGTGTFSYDVRRTATLVVPEGRENAYRTAEVWKDFTNLSTPTPIEGIGKDPADNNRRVYSIDGIRRQSMPKGIYVINGRKVVKE